MDGLGRHALSVILSFLNENDGTCFLITKKRYTRFLPLFRLKKPEGLVVLTDNNHNKKKNRHRYVVVPVQDPKILLERLNTRRLCARIRRSRKRRRYSSNSNSKSNSNNETKKSSRQQQQQQREYGLSTTELAEAEWRRQEQQEEAQTFAERSLSPNLDLLRFLNRSSIHADNQFYRRGITALVSYPRSGNTLLRTLLERVTGIVTGSDTRPDRALSLELAMKHNLVGEGVTSLPFTPFVKTHWPERIGCQVYGASRAIVLVRNPWDSIDSYWNLCATNTHTKTVCDSVYETHRAKLGGLVRNEIRVWNDFYRFWLSTPPANNGSTNSSSSNRRRLNADIPRLVVRFEDLIQNPADTMIQILKFILGTNNNELHPFWLQRIKHAIPTKTTTTTNATATITTLQQSTDLDTTHQGKSSSSGDGAITTTTNTTTINTEELGSYQPRASGKGIQSLGKSLRKKHLYTEELIRCVLQTAAGTGEEGTMENNNLLHEFGYDVTKQGFPQNFVQGTAPPPPSPIMGSSGYCATANSNNNDPKKKKNGRTTNSNNTTANAVVKVNAGPLVRPSDCPFGRPMRNWRLALTNNDTEPFPTV